MTEASAPVYLVFGAYGGVGSALSRRLAEDGAAVAVSGRDPDRLRSLAGETGGVAWPADATDFEAVEGVVAAVVGHYGRLDGVVNCVGSLLLKPAHLTRPREWHDTVQTNLTSAFAILRSSAPALTRSGGGSLVLVSTAAASIGLANHEAIAASKGGIEALVRSAAATYGRSGVRVNAVAPGLVETPLTTRITGNEKAREASESMHALGRLGTPGDVSDAIRWLLSPSAAWVTGQVLGIDGGLSSVRAGRA